jgi:uncharacterized protein involved in exopolysaccharide biosynthesis
MTDARKTSTEPISSRSIGGVISGVELNREPVGEQPLIRLRLRRALRMRGRWVAGFAMAGCLLAVGFVLYRRPVYSATAMLYVPPSPQRILPNGIPNWPYDSPTYEMHIQEQINAFTRQDVLTGALTRLRGTGWQRAKENDQIAEQRLLHSFTAARDGNSYQIAVKAQASTAELAARMANALTESYLENQGRQEEYGATTRIHLLQQEQRRVETLLASDQQQLEGVNRQLGVGAISATTPDPYDQEVSDLRMELAKARSAHDLAVAQLLSAQSGAYIGDTQSQAQSDPGLISLKTGLYQRRSALISQMAGLTLHHPLYKQDTIELQQLDKAIDEVTAKLEASARERIGRKLDGEVKTTEDEVEKLSAELARATVDAGNSTQYLQQANGLSAEIERLQKRYGMIDEQMHDQMLQQEAPNGIHIAAAAVAPIKPDASKTLLEALAVVIFFGMLGLGAAVVRNRLDPLIHVSEDLEEVIGAKALVVVPDAAEVSERFREQTLLRVVAALEDARRSREARNFLLLGVAQETMVEDVSAQLRRCQRSVQPGWEWVRTSDAEADGNGQDIPLLSFEEAAAHFRAETKRERCMAVLCEPFLLSGETEYLARFSDVVLVVVESGVTRREELLAATEALQRMPVKLAGFLLVGSKLAHLDAEEAQRIRTLDERARKQSKHEERISRLIGKDSGARSGRSADDARQNAD